jgi:GH24 family phage-related lysozyme (muramidase)
MPAEGATTAGNVTMSMSGAARARMREREMPIYNYYDDGGRPGRGNCTWGIGTLAHRGPCTADEIKRKVAPAAVEAAFASRVAEAEHAVRRNVPHQTLDQAQFDALVSFAYNVGERGAKETFKRVDKGDFKAAATGISQSIKMRVKTKTGSKLVIAKGLIQRRAEESAPFRPKDT